MNGHAARAIRVEVLEADGRIELPRTLTSAVGFAGTNQWMDLVRKVYGFQVYRIVAVSGAELLGYLALAHVKHPVLGDYLVTAPFASSGGLAFQNRATRDMMLAEARALRDTVRAEYVNVRFVDREMDPPTGWSESTKYSGYEIDLRVGPDAMLLAYSSDHRNHIRKSLRRGFTVEFGRAALLDDVYDVLAHSMHELGSPYHSKDYLHAMSAHMGENIELALLRSATGSLVGAGVFIIHGDVVSNLHANILRRFRRDYAGEFLYWSAISRYAAAGLRVFDLGRSLTGSGNDLFKSKWQPRKRVLGYWYALRDRKTLPELDQKSPRFQLAIWAWKRLPFFVVQAAGPYLIGGLA